jgi:hypothetical protein
MNQSEEGEMGGAFSKNGNKRNRYIGRKARGKTPLGRPRRRWVDNIMMNLGEIGWGDVDWIGVAQDRDSWKAHVNAVMNLPIP